MFSLFVSFVYPAKKPEWLKGAGAAAAAAGCRPGCRAVGCDIPVWVR